VKDLAPGVQNSQHGREADGDFPASGRAVCRGMTLAGAPCKAPTMAAVAPDGLTYCCNHHPAVSKEQRTVWAKRGGLVSTKLHVERKLEALTGEVAQAGLPTPSYATAADTRQYLEKVSAKVEAGQLAPSQAGAIAQLAALAIKLAELQAERDLLDLELEQARGVKR
jgi:hypothetical protein